MYFEAVHYSISRIFSLFTFFFGQFLATRLTSPFAVSNPKIVRRAIANVFLGLALCYTNSSYSQWQQNPDSPKVYVDPLTDVKPIPSSSLVGAGPEWYRDKLHPALAAIMLDASTSMVDVIVYLKRPDVDSAISQIDSNALPEINRITDQIQQFSNMLQPQQPLNAEAEQIFQQNQSPAPIALNLWMEATEQLDVAMGERRNAKNSVITNAVQQIQNEVISEIEPLGGIVIEQLALPNALHIRLPAFALDQLVSIKHVLSIVENPDKELELDVSIPSSGYSDFWTSSGTLTGGSFDLGMPEGVQANHPDLQTHGFIVRAGTTATSHGTHVNGIVSSTSPTYRGGAFGHDKIIVADTGRGQASAMADMEWMTTVSDPPETVNHSLGFGTVTEDYSSNDAFYDLYAQEYDILITKSAGNRGWLDIPTITKPAGAYNIMVVGNMDSQRTNNRLDDVRSLSSSIGPTINSRKKPDISAPGSNIHSTNMFWAEPGISDFVPRTGTSMAAPHVAAAALLLADAGTTHYQAQKAVLINTADAWTSNNTPSTDDDGPVDGSHWDKAYGWGYLDVSEAQLNATDVFIATLVPRNNTNIDDDYRLYRGMMTIHEKATLAWEKRVDVLGENSSASDSFPLSDLDLALYRENDGIVMDLDTDLNDNVQQVAADSNGIAVIKVFANSENFQGISEETYFLATEELFESVSPPSFVLSGEELGTVTTGETFNVSIEITNQGDVGAPNTIANLNVPDSLLVNSSTSKELGLLEADSATLVTWSVTALNSTGTFSLDVDVSSQSYGELFSASASNNIEVIHGAIPETPSPLSPIGEIVESSDLKFNWKSVNTATWYQLYVQGSDSVLHNLWYTANNAGCPNLSEICNITFENDFAGVVTWWVRAYNSSGVGRWSAANVFSFEPLTPPPAATLNLPFGFISDPQPIYAWDAVASATWYRLYVMDATGKIIDTWYTSAESNCNSGTETCSIKPPTTVTGRSRWWIGTYNSHGYGPWSNFLEFTAP